MPYIRCNRCAATTDMVACASGCQRCGAPGGAAGTNPKLCIVAMSLARSGGPPALMIDATSRKYCGPMSGVLITSARATTVCGLLKAWTMPRGVAMESPGCRLVDDNYLGRSTTTI